MTDCRIVSRKSKWFGGDGSSSGLDMPTDKQVDWRPMIQCSAVRRAKKNGHSKIPDWNGKKMAEAGQATVDRCNWRNMVSASSTGGPMT